MRIAIHALLIAALFAPFLACAMAFCPLRAAQAAERSAAPPPCHAAATKASEPQGPMLAVDCLGVDLFKAGAYSLDLPDMAAAAHLFIPLAFSFASRPVDVQRSAPWPPPDRPVLSSALWFVATTRLLI